MTDIPRDIMQAAETVHISILGRGTVATVEVIAKAILEERERCAKIADAVADRDYYDAPGDNLNYGRSLAGEEIASAIRGQSVKETTNGHD